MNIIHINENYSYGYHVNKFDTFYKTINFVIYHTPFTAIQIYLSNSRSNAPPKIDLEDILKTKSLIKTYSLNLFAHGCLLYNLCGAPQHKNDPNFEYNIKNVTNNLPIELDIIAALGGEGVVVHPNSCHDVKKGLKTASKIIDFVLKKDTPTSKLFSDALGISNDDFKKRRRVIIENSAHEGGKRGWNLEELNTIILGVSEDVRSQVSVCIDTAHAFGSGIYDFGIVDDIHRFYKDFDEVIGISKLKMFHINDSRISNEKANNAFFGSCKDRHANLGLGYIFDERIESRATSLVEFFKLALSKKIHLIGEPPCDIEGEICDWNIVSRALLKNDIFLYNNL